MDFNVVYTVTSYRYLVNSYVITILDPNNVSSTLTIDYNGNAYLVCTQLDNMRTNNLTNRFTIERVNIDSTSGPVDMVMVVGGNGDVRQLV